LSLDEAAAMRATVRAAAADAGRDPDEITCAANLMVDFTPDGPRITGTSEAVAQRLILIRRAGFTVLNVPRQCPRPLRRRGHAAGARRTQVASYAGRSNRPKPLR
jgi:hypothetical protein